MRDGGRFSGLALVFAVLVTGTVVSLAIFDAQRRSEDVYASQLMDRYADDVTSAIDDRVSRYGETLSDLASAVGAQADLDADDFGRSSAALNAARLPGASAVAFVVPAASAEVAAAQQHWRGRGAPGLTLKPKAGAAQHYFVIFNRVFDNGTALPGTDLAASPEATKAMTLSRQISAMVISPAYQLLSDRAVAADRRQTSIVLAVPVLTGVGTDEPDRFEGWVVMGVRGQNFLSQTLIDRGQGAVQASLTDAAADNRLIAAVLPGTRVSDDKLLRERSVRAGQRRWQVTMWPTTRLLAATDRGMSVLSGGAGLALTIMLAVVTGVLLSSRNRAFRQVEEATGALRKDIVRREAVEAQLREREQQLHQLAFHDSLTGLANRQSFYERLEQALASDGEGAVAVLFIDLDGFKQINDARGHHAGDTVLQVVAERLRDGIRQGDTVARFGGDEFAILLERVSDIVDAHAAAERIIADVRVPIDIAGVPAYVSTSVGIALHHPGWDAADLLREADAAMYAAKAAGKNRYVMA
ncbi:sensor domain-containing diguanylate cyclase [Paractinoplanes lichenicola]|uniref:Sensor domain-containing diguanylate cyclase n=1 Tax=Paractinoplanes lichenicola TaxID=2802976 RepID=A0ABS1VX79_9ACTN|nr:sensor domain-containing diguanylate cyclase [Actinoplanes lichenicola]MBL7259060.1 sensor domain-containing diguanylate cyclase [Actinoplanes lichenicola]